MSSAIASGDAGERTQVPTDENKEESTARADPQRVKRADTQRVKRAGPTAGKDQQVTAEGRNEDPGRGLTGRGRVQDERRYGRHELCGQHGRQEHCHHDRERHLHLRRGQRRSDREREGRDVGDSAITRPVSQEHLGEVSRQVNMTVDDRQGKEA